MKVAEAEQKKKQAIIDQQQAELLEITRRMENMQRHFDTQYKAVTDDLRKTQAAHLEDKKNLASVLHTPRQIQFIPTEFESQIDPITPAKRGRIDGASKRGVSEEGANEVDQGNVSPASSDEISNFLHKLKENNLSISSDSSSSKMSTTPTSKDGSEI